MWSDGGFRSSVAKLYDPKEAVYERTEKKFPTVTGFRRQTGAAHVTAVTVVSVFSNPISTFFVLPYLVPLRSYRFVAEDQ